MALFKIANVLLEDTRQFHEAPTLYVHASGFVTPAEERDAWQLTAGISDFTTFFNALSVAKWRQYTVAEHYSLHLELRGAACTVRQTHAVKLDLEPQNVQENVTEVPASTQWQSIDIDLVLSENDVLAGFSLESEGTIELRNSYYATEVEDEAIRPVELAIATTTFRKEEYIERNIQLVRGRILNSGERAANHLTMHVVDNGRTLDAEALSGGGIFVHPNDNVGGAGGFARGMLEAMGQDTPATHVLLMDDDVEVSPESILRTWNLLALVNDEWNEAFVAGAMMSWTQPDMLWEDGGFMSFAGVCGIVKGGEIDKHVSRSTAIIANETFTPNTRSFADLNQRYAAWWYCCIPITVIKREGMPLPLFVRYDDVEYSLRCKPKFMTMNGICIWHLDFSLRYNAAVEHYQTTRNSMVIQATTNAAPLSNFESQLLERAMIELSKFNYPDAQLIVDGFEDFLKGPGFYAAPGMAERTYLEANRRREQLIPYDELRTLCLEETGIDIDDFDPADIARDYPLGLTMHASPFRVSRMQTFQKSINGQLFGKLKQYVGPTGIVTANASWQVGRVYGVDHVIAIDVPSKRGVLRHRDNTKCKAIWSRLLDNLKEYHDHKEEIEELYRESRQVVTSEAFWRQYLGM